MFRLPQAVTTIVVFCTLLAPFGVAHADPNVDARKTGVLTDDVDGDGFADPGDTITYTVIISNTGNMDATDVSFSDTIDANSTLVGGSVKTTPLALDDNYNVTGNVQISVPAPGVLGNDFDPDGSGGVTDEGGSCRMVPGTPPEFR
ncbi:MAG: DUF11 domain-containing protein [Planctomycetes bacterium]|nr:DUF11 domain-containing protein [Planctomycetota bacterium]